MMYLQIFVCIYEFHISEETGEYKGYEKIINGFICRIFNAVLYDRQCACGRVRTGLQRGDKDVSGFL